ncbi:SDR family oxidoreductase [Cytobacillus suaedae]|nr:SDR family oxidoreductase [Cytobacillus suaedae]
MDFQLQGKTALVIASSQGLGKAIAKQLVEEGANVMITSRNVEKLQLVRDELQKLGKGKVSYLQADITKIEEIKNVVEKTIDDFGSIDLLVNNAGGPPAGSIDTLTDEQWQQSFELNLLSYVRIIRETLPYLRKQGGKIVNVASVSIKEPIPGLLLSNTFRLGIVGLTKTLATELAPENIIINTVAPGRIETDRISYLDQVNADKLGVTKEEVKQRAEMAIPLGRSGEPEEFAKVVTFLLSGANTYMTGNSYLVDGGMVKSI